MSTLVHIEVPTDSIPFQVAALQELARRGNPLATEALAQIRELLRDFGARMKLSVKN